MKKLKFNQNSSEPMTRKIRDYSIGKNYYIRTYGCQLNENDSEKIEGVLNNLGFIESKERKNS